MFEALGKIPLGWKVGQFDPLKVLEVALSIKYVRVSDFPLAGVGAEVVDGEHHGGVTGVLGTADQNLGQLAVLEEVELEPQRVLRHPGHLLDAVAGGGAEGHDGIGGSGGAGGGQFAGRVGPLVGAGGRKHHGEADALAQDLGGHVALADVNEHAGTQRDRFHCPDVGGVGGPVGRVQVAEEAVEHRLGYGLLGPGLEIVDGEQGVLGGHVYLLKVIAIMLAGVIRCRLQEAGGRRRIMK